MSHHGHSSFGVLTLHLSAHIKTSSITQCQNIVEKYVKSRSPYSVCIPTVPLTPFDRVQFLPVESQRRN